MTYHAEHDGGTEGGVVDRADNDLLAHRSHLLDEDAVDVGVGLVVLAVLEDGVVGSADALLVLDVDLDAAGIGLVEDLRGDDLHDDREADLLGDGDSLVGGLGQLDLGDRDVVGGEDLLGLDLGQGVATVGAGGGDDGERLLLGALGAGVLVEGVVRTLLEEGGLVEGGEGAHRLSRVVVQRDLGGLEDDVALGALLATDEARDDGLAAVGDLVVPADDGVGDLVGLGDRGLAVEDGDTADPLVLEGDLEALLVALEAGAAGDVDGVLGGAEARHALVERLLQVLGGGLQRDAVHLGSVGGQDADAAAVRDDDDVVALHRGLHGEGDRVADELLQVHGADDLGLLERGVVDLDGAREGAGVGRGGGGAVGRDAGLQGDDGLAGSATSLDEVAAVLDALDVERDALGVLVLRVVVDGVSEVDVGHVAEGDHGRAAKVLDVGGGVQRDEEGAGLRDEGGVASVRQARGERGVGVAGVQEQADDVRAQNATAGLLSHADELLLGLGVADLAEAGGDDDVALDLLLARLLGAADDELLGDGVDSQVDRLDGDVLDRGESGQAADGGGLGVDREDLALKKGEINEDIQDKKN